MGESEFLRPPNVCLLESQRRGRFLIVAQLTTVFAGTSKVGIMRHNDVRAGFALVPVPGGNRRHDSKSALVDAVGAPNDGSGH